jgi:hypothetical protein
MTRQKGVFKFNWSNGGVSFYKTAEDGYLARQKGGVDAERIKNSPEFERTRENGAEFGRAGVASKILRTSKRRLSRNNGKAFFILSPYDFIPCIFEQQTSSANS